MQRTFTAYGETELRRVDSFKYLGRVLSYDDCDTPAIRRNLKRAQAVWGRISIIVPKECVPLSVAGMFYQAVVAAVLLYGSKTWVVSSYDMRATSGGTPSLAMIVEMRPHIARALLRLWRMARVS